MNLEDFYEIKDYIIFEELLDKSGLTVADLSNDGDERVFDLYLNARRYCPDLCEEIFNYKIKNMASKTITVEQRINRHIFECKPEITLLYNQPYGAVWKRVWKEEEPLSINTDYIVGNPSEDPPGWRSFGKSAFRFDNYWGALVFMSNRSDGSKIRLTTAHTVVMKSDIKEGRRVYRPYKDDLIFKHIPQGKDEYNCEMSYGFIKTLVDLKKGDTLLLKKIEDG